MLTPKNTCPKCKSILDGATSTSEDVSPQEGDISICLYCLEVLVFNENGGLREITDQELVDHSEVIKEGLKVTKHVHDNFKKRGLIKPGGGRVPFE